MMSTNELEEYVTKEINSRIDDVCWEYVHFEDDAKTGYEGWTFFYKDGMYHGVHINEKGVFKEDFITDKKEEVLEKALRSVTVSTVFLYAIRLKKKGEEFRKTLIQKELEIYSKFGGELYEKKKAEIDEILSRNPYNDNTH